MKQAKFMVLIKLNNEEVTFWSTKKLKDIKELEQVFDETHGEEFKVFELNDNNTYNLAYSKHNRKIGF